jgi:hypothetical protein
MRETFKKFEMLKLILDYMRSCFVLELLLLHVFSNISYFIEVLLRFFTVVFFAFVVQISEEDC